MWPQWFARAAAASKGPQTGWFKQQRGDGRTALEAGSLRSGVSGLVPSEAGREKLFQTFPVAFGGVPAVFSVAQPVETPSSSLPSFSRDILLCVSLPKFPLFIRPPGVLIMEWGLS